MATNGYIPGLYPSPAFRADRIARQGKLIEQGFLFDAASAESCGRDHVGLFVQSSGSLARLIQKLHYLDRSDVNTKWIVAVSTANEHWRSYNLWRNLASSEFFPPKNIPLHWEAQRIIFTTPERLVNVAENAVMNNTRVAGLILIDLNCMVHKARGNQWVANDRPQHVIDCRARLTTEEWSPPLIVFTDGLARSINTEPMRGAYSLNAWRYFDGQTFTFNTTACGCWDHSNDLVTQ